MKKLKGTKKTGSFTRKSYYSALAICLAMVGLGCFCSYRQTADKLNEELSSVTDEYKKPVVTAVLPENKDVVDAAKNKHGVKKETTAPVVTEPPVSETTQVHSETEAQTKAEVRKYTIPVNGEILQEFSGEELVKNNTTGAWQTHNGTDIAAAQGDEVRAMASGTVTDVYDDPLWGTVVEIDHGEGIKARYCGLNKGLNVEKGNSVSAREVIGAVGGTADVESSMESHLHLEVTRNDRFVDPIDVINNN